jgi:polysaccharide chain length determinant protein (PEP-CTERM system associated)
VIPGKAYTPELVLAIAWRRKWLVLIPTVLIAVVACVVTYTLKDEYRSETTVLVVPQQVPEQYVRSTVNTKIEDRLRSINQQVRSRTRLERIIEEFHLYPERRKKDIMQDIVDDMNKAIDVDIVQNDVFRVSFLSDKPRTAQQVTERLASFFVDDSLRDRTVYAEGASQFLEAQLAESARALRETEQKIAEYKQKHDGELPAQSDSNRQGLSNSQMQLVTVNLAIDRARDQKADLQRRIDELTAAVEAAAALPPAPQDTAAPQTKAVQLEAARAEMRRMLTTKRPGHPDVDRLELRITKLEREAAEEAANATPLTAETPANPLAIRRLQALDSTKDEFDRLNRSIETYINEQRRLTRQINDYQHRMEMAPLRDSELIELTRDYATRKASYESLSSKHLESKMSAEVERRQIGEQFKILDQARIPEKPYSPNRPRFYMLGIILALAVGLGTAAAAEYLDRGLRSEDDVRLALALPVLASIPIIDPPKKLSWRRKALTAAAALVVTAAAGTAWLILR